MRDPLAPFLRPTLRALLLKEIRQMRRDRRVIVALILPPIFQLLLFGTVMSPDVTDLNLGIVDESGSTESRDVIAALSESGSFQLTGLYTSIDTMGDDISLGALDAGIVIPQDFARDLRRGRPATVQVLLNAMNANTAAIGHGYIVGVFESYNRTMQGRGIRTDVRQAGGPVPPSRGRALLRPVFLFNPGMISSWFLVTGLLGQLLMVSGLITASTTMVKEREAGTLEQLMMTPARVWEIVVAKIVPPFVLLGIPAIIALTTLRLYFGIPFRGSVPLLLVSCAACSFCGIGIGTFVATITRTAQQAQLSAFFIMPPLVSLAGAVTPAEAIPAWMQPGTLINPIYHFGVISRGTLIRGSGLADVWPNLLGLLLIAFVLMTLSVWRFRKQLS